MDKTLLFLSEINIVVVNKRLPEIPNVSNVIQKRNKYIIKIYHPKHDIAKKKNVYFVVRVNKHRSSKKSGYCDGLGSNLLLYVQDLAD